LTWGEVIVSAAGGPPVGTLTAVGGVAGPVIHGSIDQLGYSVCSKPTGLDVQAAKSNIQLANQDVWSGKKRFIKPSVDYFAEEIRKYIRL